MKYKAFIAPLILAFATGVSAATLNVDPKASECVVEVRATGHSFEVAVAKFDATVSIDNDGSVATAKFECKAVDLASDNAKRDRKMRKWMAAESNPAIRFELDSVIDRNGKKVGVGALSLAGASKEVEIPFSLSRDGDKATLEGSAIIDHQDWGLEIITMFFLTVKPELSIRFTLVGALEN